MSKNVKKVHPELACILQKYIFYSQEVPYLKDALVSVGKMPAKITTAVILA